MNLIDVDVLLAEIEEEIEAEKSYDDYDRSVTVGLRIAYKDIKKQPKVEAETIKHGQWLPHKITASSKCSECRRVFADETPYCPNCGARMDGDVNE